MPLARHSAQSPISSTRVRLTVNPLSHVLFNCIKRQFADSGATFANGEPHIIFMSMLITGYKGIQALNPVHLSVSTESVKRPIDLRWGRQTVILQFPQNLISAERASRRLQNTQNGRLIRGEFSGC